MRERAGFGIADIDPQIDLIARDVIDAAAHVRTILGVGLYEKVYRVCLARELEKRGHVVRQKVKLPLIYHGELLIEDAYEVDMIVDDRVIVEAKATLDNHPAYEAQTLTYMRLGKKPLGLLINFHAIPLASGMRRFVMSEFL